MEFFDSSGFDIFDVYMRYCEIKSGNACLHGMEGHMLSDEIEKVKFSREALVQLSKVVDSRINERVSIFEALYRLMSRLNLSGDFSEFSNFYEFVFFICRENGQKNITVSKAIAAWKLVLAGRFRLLNQWCDFVEKNQRHNISEDTWGQVLAFSRCVHENLEGYDPEGAWPTLIDDFVEHMYRVTGSRGRIDCNFTCHCGDPDAQAFASEDALPGLKNFPGLKRKLHDDCHRTSPDISSSLSLDVLNLKIDSKRRKQLSQLAKCENEPPEGIRHQSSLNPPKSPCGVEGCLSKGFATLLSSHSCAHIDQDTGYLVHECSM